jgi:hypothetical protein
VRCISRGLALLRVAKNAVVNQWKVLPRADQDDSEDDFGEPVDWTGRLLTAA